jgi:hypothetical protein
LHPKDILKNPLRENKPIILKNQMAVGKKIRKKEAV